MLIPVKVLHVASRTAKEGKKGEDREHQLDELKEMRKKHTGQCIRGTIPIRRW